VDVGINSRGLVNGYALDIAKLRNREQQHWASYSTLPDGEVCYELFETRMQQRPPDSPNVVETIQSAREALSQAFDRLEVELYRQRDPSKRERMRLTLGPITDDPQELARLAQILYDWVVEAMKVASLRSVLEANHIGFDVAMRQIGLLGLLLSEFSKVSATDVTRLMQPFELLNRLRIKSAHTVSGSVEQEFRQADMIVSPFEVRAAYVRLVDSLCAGAEAVGLALDR
jgi:hypothetical protein